MMISSLKAKGESDMVATVVKTICRRGPIKRPWFKL